MPVPVMHKAAGPLYAHADQFPPTIKNTVCYALDFKSITTLPSPRDPGSSRSRDHDRGRRRLPGDVL